MRTQTMLLLLATIVICLAAHGLCIGNSTNSRCKCVKVISRFIHPRKYQHVDIFPQGSYCRRVEVVITLKNGKMICVDPKIQWVKTVVTLLTERRRW
ncbi:interleukin-8-like isoform X2 [Heptranchias perlo]|uniref:interleukin-8-like isoform X2 n=1 Tax=Heptranchias perlo TaxID=212740 RepID=UPI0035596A76